MPTSQREQRAINANVGLRDASGGGRVAFGEAVVFGALSHQLHYFRERFEPGAFDECLRKNPDILALMHHDTTKVLGRTKAKTLRLNVDEKALSVECDLPSTSYASDLAECLRSQAIGGMSFAFQSIDEEWAKQDGVLLRVVKKADLFEVSWVTDPAYPQTTAGVRSLSDVAAEAEQRVLPKASASFPKRSIWRWKTILAERSAR